MERSRPQPVQMALALAGIILAVVGLVRVGQGRPERHRAAVATTIATAADTAAGTAAGSDTAAASASASTDVTPASGAVSVDIVDFAFAPDPLDIAVGTTVTWTNKDSFAHTATATDPTIFDSKNLGNAMSFSYTFATAGTFTYRCAIHNSMTGTVVVK